MNKIKKKIDWQLKKKRKGIESVVGHLDAALRAQPLAARVLPALADISLGNAHKRHSCQ